MNEVNFSEIQFMDHKSLAFVDSEDCLRALLTLRSDELSPQDEIINNIKKTDMVISPRQIHGSNVIEAVENVSLPLRPEVDGIIITSPGIVGTLQFADCFPVVLFSKVPHSWVMLLHSGFKGTVENIVNSGWKKIKEIFPLISPEEVEAWIGPGIGPCCYSRKIEDMWTKKAMLNFNKKFFSIKGEYVNFNLPEVIFSQIHNLGVKSEKIYSQGECSSCNCHKFYSYRKKDKKSRMVLVAQIQQQ